MVPLFAAASKDISHPAKLAVSSISTFPDSSTDPIPPSETDPFPSAKSSSSNVDYNKNTLCISLIGVCIHQKNNDGGYIHCLAVGIITRRTKYLI